jgi:putative mRNA 3-end processing factor
MSPLRVMATPLLTLPGAGLFCESGGFHIDPGKGVKLALVTHAHSDHARRGSEHYLCVEQSVGLLKLRLGEKAQITGVPYGEILRLGETQVSFHPAGHILGSAQVRIERRGEVWVASGDYKREADPTCLPFEVVPCDTFVTEATFEHPSYEWVDTRREILAIREWWEENRRQGRNSLLYCYAVGKTQRVLSELATLTTERVLLFGEANRITQCYRELGISMVSTTALEDTPPGQKIEGELIIAPHSISSSPWLSRLDDPNTAFASGWMRTGAFGARNRYDHGFTISDHADWPGLLRTVEETGAKQVRVLSKNDGPLVRHLRKQGIDARAFEKEGAAPKKGPSKRRPPGPDPIQTEFPF